MNRITFHLTPFWICFVETIRHSLVFAHFTHTRRSSNSTCPRRLKEWRSGGGDKKTQPICSTLTVTTTRKHNFLAVRVHSNEIGATVVLVSGLSVAFLLRSLWYGKCVILLEYSVFIVGSFVFVSFFCLYFF